MNVSLLCQMKKFVLLGPVNYVGFEHTKATALKKVCKILEASKAEKKDKICINKSKNKKTASMKNCHFTMRQYLPVKEGSSGRNRRALS